MAAEAGPPAGTPDDRVVAVVREVLQALPAGCTWLLPIRGRDRQVVDFQVAATSGYGHDLYSRGTGRVGQRLSGLYPSMVGGQLWQAYLDVLATGTPLRVPAFEYHDRSAGIVAESVFDVTVHRVMGGLLVWWQRLDEDQRRLERTEQLGSLGWAEYDLLTGRSEWSGGMYRMFGRDPALGPLSRADQAAIIVPEDARVGETVWQTLDSGATSDVTVRVRVGGAVKYLRILSDVARDADGTPLKLYAMVQDVTAREDSRSALERLGDQLRTREMTALAEHRLAAQLQNMIQPVPAAPFRLAGLEAMVSYLPAESVARVGGDWYHAQTQPDGTVVLAIGDVAGHGLPAASGMAHLRFALVAWLSIGIRDPGTLLRHLNQLCGQLRITGTAVVAAYDPATRILRWARAGHLPPLLARGGATHPLDRLPGLLLGGDPSSGYPVAELPLHPGELVLFYTDGLVERRAADQTQRLDRVARTLSALTTQPDSPPLTLLRGLLTEASPDDDTCTLTVRVLRDVAVTGPTGCAPRSPADRPTS
jgi:serine phosphatase RsbU (regulator of sigma subunit)